MDTNLPDVVYRSLYWHKEHPYDKELVCQIPITLHNGRSIVIPVGFQTDLATVPRLFWNIVPTSGRHDLAVIIHDYLLEEGYERKFADEELRIWLKISGVGYVQRALIYRAVRLYSWFQNLKKSSIIKQY